MLEQEHAAPTYCDDDDDNDDDDGDDCRHDDKNIRLYTLGCCFPPKR